VSSFTPHIVCRPQGDGITWPDFDTTDGRPAVVCFSEKEKAVVFMEGKGMGGGWNVGRMDVPEFLRWLRHNLLNGTPLVMVDPTAKEGKAVEIFRFLAAAEGATGGTESNS
jgi:hypothetical protein